MTLWYYTVPVPTDSLRSQTPTDRQSVSTLTGLAGATPAVDATGQQPGDLRLDGQFRDTFASVQASELRALASSDGFDAMPLFLDDGTFPQAGYYTAERAGGSDAVPQTQALADFDVSLTRTGTRESHRRLVTTAPTSADHPFGIDTAGLVGLPAQATDVQWLSPARDASQPASPTSTVTSELGDVDLYDVDTAPYAPANGSGAALVYGLPLAREGDTDVAVYDTRGVSETDSEGRFAWRRGFTSDFVPEGGLVISTGRIRLRIDPAGPTLAAERYSSGSWTDVTLGASSWSLAAYSLGGGTAGRVGPARTTVWAMFTDGAQRVAADLTLSRGRDDVLVTERDTPLPSGLADLLDPIAAPQITAPTASQTLIARDQLP